jgi:hypothetical protein
MHSGSILFTEYEPNKIRPPGSNSLEAHQNASRMYVWSLLQQGRSAAPSHKKTLGRETMQVRRGSPILNFLDAFFV